MRRWIQNQPPLDQGQLSNFFLPGPSISSCNLDESTTLSIYIHLVLIMSCVLLAPKSGREIPTEKQPQVPPVFSSNLESWNVLTVRMPALPTSGRLECKDGEYRTTALMDRNEAVVRRILQLTKHITITSSGLLTIFWLVDRLHLTLLSFPNTLKGWWYRFTGTQTVLHASRTGHSP